MIIDLSLFNEEVQIGIMGLICITIVNQVKKKLKIKFKN